MWKKILDSLKARSFSNDEEKTRRARALKALHLNMGGRNAWVGHLRGAVLLPGKILILHYFRFGHSGNVDWYDLESGKGSIFYFTLPPADSQGIL